MDPAYRPLRWAEQRPALHDWLAQHPDEVPALYREGREARILTLGNPPQFALKIWRDGYPADPRRDYDLLQRAGAVGLPVAEPVGWGADGEGRPLLATRFEGRQLGVVSPHEARWLARLLAGVHAVPLPDLGLPSPPLPLSTLVDRYAAEAAEHPDVRALMEVARRRLPSQEAAFVHGDFHAGNVVEANGHLRLLDWGEAGPGDQRYDLAWAALLLWIYSGEEAYHAFLDEYAAAGGNLGGLREAELIAAARWLFLARTAPVPINGEWIEAVRRFLAPRLPPECSVAEIG